jgi:hypothetical protein
MAQAIGGGALESEKELAHNPEDHYSVWQRELEAAKKHYERYLETSERILKRYRDEREEANLSSASARLNFFWSNTQVLKSTLYAKPPKVDVSRLFRDYSDDNSRVAGVILERLLNHDLEKDTSDFDVAARQAIDDWLIVGSGTLWYRYEVETEEVPMMQPAPMPQSGAPAPGPPGDHPSGGPALPPAGPPGAPPGPANSLPEASPQVPVMGEDGQPVMTERIVHEDALSDYVYWADFLCSPARTWQEVRWVARRVKMTRDALVERFGEDIGSRVPLKSARRGAVDRAPGGEDDPWAAAEVWEIWCRTNRRVYWVVLGFETFLDMREDPLQLERFFPCPEPLLANKTNDTLIPRADYSMARDQYTQIDQIVSRMRILVDACKVRGAYDKESAPQLANILVGPENKMVPVENWALFGEKGGLKGVVDWVPIDMVVNVIAQLRIEMAEQKQELYEALGIADIMRGATRASETATAQQIKAQFGSTRLQFKQFEVGRFVRDAQRIKADIICKHYQPQTMLDRSNIMQTPDAQHAPKAIELLKGDLGVTQYRLNIEPDSMAALDWASERDARTQFLQAVGGFIQQALPLAQSAPEAVPFLAQMLQWGLSGFRVGKEIEGTIDQMIQQMQQKPPGPSPEEKAEQKRAREAEVAKTESESLKNRAGAVKSTADAQRTMMETRGQQLANQGEAQIVDIMSRTPGAPAAAPGQEESYVQR